MIGGFSLVAIQAIHVGDSATDEVSSIITSPRNRFDLLGKRLNTKAQILIEAAVHGLEFVLKLGVFHGAIAAKPPMTLDLTRERLLPAS